MKLLNVSIYFIAILASLVLISSCRKNLDLVAKTTEGKNTLGYYLNGIPVNYEGEYELGGWGFFSDTKGVGAGLYNGDCLLRIQADQEETWTDESEHEITIEIPWTPNPEHGETPYELNKAYTIKYAKTEWTNETVHGEFFETDSLHTGSIIFTRLEYGYCAGTFQFDGFNWYTKEDIKVRNGRFDIKWR